MQGELVGYGVCSPPAAWAPLPPQTEGIHRILHGFTAGAALASCGLGGTGAFLQWHVAVPSSSATALQHCGSTQGSPHCISCPRAAAAPQGELGCITQLQGCLTTSALLLTYQTLASLLPPSWAAHEHRGAAGKISPQMVGISGKLLSFLETCQ